jgi:hypothetical protein
VSHRELDAYDATPFVLIAQLMQQYAHCIDQRRFDQMRDCFTADAEVLRAGLATAIDEYLVALEVGARSYGRTLHLLGMPWVRLRPDNSATSCTYGHSWHFADENAEVLSLEVVVRYDDELRFENGAWRITRREVHPWWTRRHTAAPRG